MKGGRQREKSCVRQQRAGTLSQGGGDALSVWERGACGQRGTQPRLTQPLRSELEGGLMRAPGSFCLTEPLGTAPQSHPGQSLLLESDHWRAPTSAISTGCRGPGARGRQGREAGLGKGCFLKGGQVTNDIIPSGRRLQPSTYSQAPSIQPLSSGQHPTHLHPPQLLDLNAAPANPTSPPKQTLTC